jgi:hypothetical protein
VVNTSNLYSGSFRFESRLHADYTISEPMWFSSVPPRNCRSSTLTQATTVSFHILLHFHPIIRSYELLTTTLKFEINYSCSKAYTYMLVKYSQPLPLTLNCPRKNNITNRGSFPRRIPRILPLL